MKKSIQTRLGRGAISDLEDGSLFIEGRDHCRCIWQKFAFDEKHCVARRYEVCTMCEDLVMESAFKITNSFPVIKLI